MNHEGSEVAAELLRRKVSRRQALSGLAAGATLLVTTSGQDALAAPAPRKRRRRAAGAQVATSSVAANQHNVLSAVITVETAGIERLRVEYGAGGAFDQTTRELPIAGAATTVPVPRSRPASRWRCGPGRFPITCRVSRHPCRGRRNRAIR